LRGGYLFVLAVFVVGFSSSKGKGRRLRSTVQEQKSTVQLEQKLQEDGYDWVSNRALEGYKPSEIFTKFAALSKKLFTTTFESIQSETMLGMHPKERVGLQTFSEFLDVALKPSRKRNVLYLLPLPSGVQYEELKKMDLMRTPFVKDIIETVFQIKCEILPESNTTYLANCGRREHMSYDDYLELNAIELIEYLKETVNIPNDALGVIVLTPCALYKVDLDKNRTARFISSKAPMAILSLEERYKSLPEILSATIRCVLDYVGVQIPCSWFKGCILNGPDPIACKSSLSIPTESDEERVLRQIWMFDQPVYRSKSWHRPYKPPSVFTNELKFCPACLAKISHVAPNFDLEKMIKDFYRLIIRIKSEQVLWGKSLRREMDTYSYYIKHLCPEEKLPKLNYIKSSAHAPIDLSSDDKLEFWYDQTNETVWNEPPDLERAPLPPAKFIDKRFHGDVLPIGLRPDPENTFEAGEDLPEGFAATEDDEEDENVALAESVRRMAIGRTEASLQRGQEPPLLGGAVQDLPPAPMQDIPPPPDFAPDFEPPPPGLPPPEEINGDMGGLPIPPPPPPPPGM